MSIDYGTSRSALRRVTPRGANTVYSKEHKLAILNALIYFIENTCTAKEVADKLNLAKPDAFHSAITKYGLNNRKHYRPGRLAGDKPFPAHVYRTKGGKENNPALSGQYRTEADREYAYSQIPIIRGVIEKIEKDEEKINKILDDTVAIVDIVNAMLSEGFTRNEIHLRTNIPQNAIRRIAQTQGRSNQIAQAQHVAAYGAATLGGKHLHTAVRCKQCNNLSFVLSTNPLLAGWCIVCAKGKEAKKLIDEAEAVSQGKTIVRASTPSEIFARAKANTGELVVNGKEAEQEAAQASSRTQAASKTQTETIGGEVGGGKAKVLQAYDRYHLPPVCDADLIP